MKVKWKNSISVRVNVGMLGILISLFVITAISFWMTEKFNNLSYTVSDQHLPELSKSAELHLTIKNIHHKIDNLAYEDNKVGHKIVIEELIANINQLSLSIDNISVDNYSKTMSLMIDGLIPIVNSYSLDVDKSLTLKRALRKKIELLDKLYFDELETQEVRDIFYNEQLNQLYINTRSLPDHSTNFKFKNATRNIYLQIDRLNERYSHNHKNLIYINQVASDIINIVEQQYEIKLHLTVLDTQTNVIIEQLTSISFEKMTVLNKLVSNSTANLYATSNTFNNILISIVLFATFFTLLIMLALHQRVSKKLIRIANSIGKIENKSMLIEQAKGKWGESEINIIAKAMLRYIERNEQQNNKIKANIKQLMLIIENSTQAIIIYSDDKIVYSNEYCNQLLDVNDYQNTDIISQNLLMAINERAVEDRLQVGQYFLRFFATGIEWNGRESTLALMTDITNEVRKENQLIKTLEIVKDESLTDTLTGLYNRRKLEIFIEQNLLQKYSLIVADIDWFKDFNDHYGHAQGDICITTVARAIKESLRTEDDIAVRYGGEEFVILLLNSSIDQARIVAERIQNTISQLNIKHEKSIFNRLSLSFGIAHSTEFMDDDWQALFEKADARLYKAKEEGRSRVVCS